MRHMETSEFAARFAGEEWPEGPAWQPGEDGEPVTTPFAPFKARLLELSAERAHLDQLRDAFNAWRNEEARA